MGADRTAPVLIIGGGPAGAASAMHLLHRGITPLIVERAPFPRYHIGESMTSECGELVRRLGFEDDMIAAGHPIKHGVKVFGASGEPDWWVPVMQRVEDDGALTERTTWQVRRSEFDTMLLDAAVARGAELILGRAVDPIVDDRGVVCGARIRADDGSELTVAAELTLDCSGQATFLAGRGVTGRKYLGAYDKQIAMFTQVTDFERGTGGDGRMLEPGNTNIFYREKYHWAWAIPIDDEVTSVGVVAPAAYFHAAGESREDYLRRELRTLNSGLGDRLSSVDMVEPVHTVPNYSFQVDRFAGPGYLCLGDAHRFIDPIFSFGMNVALRETELAADRIVRYLEGEGRDGDDPFREHMIVVERAADILEDVLDTFWENPFAFAQFVHHRYREPMIDVFAGRIYDGDPNRGRDRAVAAFRELLGRERRYDDPDVLSMPFGSRYDPERAPLWNATLDTVEATETWMREHD